MEKRGLSSSVIDSFGCKCQRQIQYDIQYDVGLSGCPSAPMAGAENGSGKSLLSLAGGEHNAVLNTEVPSSLDPSKT